MPPRPRGSTSGLTAAHRAKQKRAGCREQARLVASGQPVGAAQATASRLAVTISCRRRPVARKFPTGDEQRRKFRLKECELAGRVGHLHGVGHHGQPAAKQRASKRRWMTQSDRVGHVARSHRPWAAGGASRSRSAAATASARELTPSLRMMFLTWERTVSIEMTRTSAT